MMPDTNGTLRVGLTEAHGLAKELAQSPPRGVKQTLHDYGGVNDERLLRKVEVVYPGVRTVPDDRVVFQDREMTLLLAGRRHLPHSDSLATGSSAATSSPTSRGTSASTSPRS